MDFEKLISVVRNHAELYDVSHKKYNDTLFKKRIWFEIGRKFNESGETCRKSWHNLRDSYRRAMKRKRTAINGKIKRWKYEDEMAFLDPYITERPQRSLSDTAFLGVEESRLEEDSKEKIDEEISEFLSKQQEVPSTIPVTDLQEKIDHSPGEEIKQALFEENKEDGRKAVAISRNVALKSFFESMFETLSTFSVRNQLIAKNKIFTIVSELELQELESREKQPFVDAQNNNVYMSLPGYHQRVPENNAPAVQGSTFSPDSLTPKISFTEDFKYPIDNSN